MPEASEYILAIHSVPQEETGSLRELPGPGTHCILGPLLISPGQVARGERCALGFLLAED